MIVAQEAQHLFQATNNLETSAPISIINYSLCIKWFMTEIFPAPIRMLLNRWDCPVTASNSTLKNGAKLIHLQYIINYHRAETVHIICDKQYNIANAITSQFTRRDDIYVNLNSNFQSFVQYIENDVFHRKIYHICNVFSHRLAICLAIDDIQGGTP